MCFSNVRSTKQRYFPINVGSKSKTSPEKYISLLLTSASWIVAEKQKGLKWTVVHMCVWTGKFCGTYARNVGWLCSDSLFKKKTEFKDSCFTSGFICPPPSFTETTVWIVRVSHATDLRIIILNNIIFPWNVCQHFCCSLLVSTSLLELTARHKWKGVVHKFGHRTSYHS